MAKKKSKKEDPLLKVIILIAALLGIVFFLQTFMKPTERRVEAGVGDVILRCYNYSVKRVMPYTTKVFTLDQNDNGIADTFALWASSGLAAYFPIDDMNNDFPILPFNIAGAGTDIDTSNKIISAMWYEKNRLEDYIDHLKKNHLREAYEVVMVDKKEPVLDVVNEDGELIYALVTYDDGSTVQTPKLDEDGEEVLEKVYADIFLTTDLLNAPDALLVAMGHNPDGVSYSQRVYQYREAYRKKYRLEYLLKLYIATQGDPINDDPKSFTDCWRLGEIPLDIDRPNSFFPVRPMIEDFDTVTDVFVDAYNNRSSGGGAGGSGGGFTGDSGGGDSGGGDGLFPGDGNGSGGSGGDGSGDSGSGDSGSGGSGGPGGGDGL